MPISTYQSLLKDYAAKVSSLQRRLAWFSAVRLFLFIGFLFFGYKALQTDKTYFTFLSVVSIIAFLIMVRVYDKLHTFVVFNKGLVQLNENEISFLEGKPSLYDSGKEFIDVHHSFSYDLDIFGEGGLFQYLNRCSTGFGREELSKLLLNPDTTSIIERQDAIDELKEKLEFRQAIQAHGMTQKTEEKEMRQLKAWISSASFFTNTKLYYALFVFPITVIGLLVYYLVTESGQALNLFYASFILNLVITGLFTKRIKKHLSVSTSIEKVLQQFSQQLQQIETADFKSILLNRVQGSLKKENRHASESIGALASLFNYLETFLNLVLSPLLNGFFLFHIHILFALEKWKKQNGNDIMNWLRLLGETEALNSLANLSYNNPSFCKPKLSSDEIIIADTMGHLLIPADKRVCNSISFAKQKFIILTGSNMSGKSTFLRTLGVNLVLARAGSFVCAREFVFFPYEVHVSMRISDSLQDSESFFYAELKRLQHIIQQLEAGNKIFVILDEILRGTNSNDKHSGTIGLIHKMAATGASGIIATHDVTVSKLALEYPNYINNKCFESDIVDDELLFDFKLRDGVCTTLSASFLMKKMNIIDDK